MVDLAETRHMGGLTLWAIAFRPGFVSNFMPFVAHHPGSLPLVLALVTAMIAAFFSLGVPSQNFFSSGMTPSRNLWLASRDGFPGGRSFFLRKMIVLEERSGVISSLLCVGYRQAPESSRAPAVLPEVS